MINFLFIKFGIPENLPAWVSHWLACTIEVLPYIVISQNAPAYKTAVLRHEHSKIKIA